MPAAIRRDPGRAPLQSTQVGRPLCRQGVPNGHRPQRAVAAIDPELFSAPGTEISMPLASTFVTSPALASHRPAVVQYALRLPAHSTTARASALSPKQGELAGMSAPRRP